MQYYSYGIYPIIIIKIVTGCLQPAHLKTTGEQKSCRRLEKTQEDICKLISFQHKSVQLCTIQIIHYYHWCSTSTIGYRHRHYPHGWRQQCRRIIGLLCGCHPQGCEEVAQQRPKELGTKEEKQEDCYCKPTWIWNSYILLNIYAHCGCSI